MLSRRSFLRATGAVGRPRSQFGRHGFERVLEASQSMAGRSPEDVAKDEFYWREIQSAFTLDRTIINLNNGHHCAPPRVVQDAVKRYWISRTRRPGITAA